MGWFRMMVIKYSQLLPDPIYSDGCDWQPELRPFLLVFGRGEDLLKWEGYE